MPRRAKQHNKCLFCGKPAHAGHRFHIDLHDGKPHIPIHTCSAEHRNHFRRVMRDFEVKDGG